jgi:exopolysaccharide biosynthesis WecB/TagA/CpsF family protein
MTRRPAQGLRQAVPAAVRMPDSGVPAPGGPPASLLAWRAGEVCLTLDATVAQSLDGSPALQALLQAQPVSSSPDGRWLRWALPARAGTRLLSLLAAHCGAGGERMLLLGCGAAANGKAVQRLRQLWPDLQVAGFAAEAYRPGEPGAQRLLGQALAAIDDYRPRYVVLGLGAADGQLLAQALAPALVGQTLGLCCLGNLPALMDDARGLDALGLQMLPSQMDVAAQTVLGAITGQRPPTAFMHANLNTLYHLHVDAASDGLGTALRSARAGVFFEGVALKMGHLLLSGRWRSDVSGTDLVPQVLARLAAPLRVALVGGRPGVAALAANALAARFPAVQVVGTWDGFADCADADSLLQAVAAARPDMVLVGMGTPIQEPLCQRLLACPTVRVAWAVGGLLDYLSGDARLAPSCIRRIRLEWLWRLVCNPRKYWRRYLVQGLWFFWFLLARLPRAVRLARAQA